MTTTTIICRSLPRVDVGYCRVMLKIAKVCQLRYFIEHIVHTIEHTQEGRRGRYKWHKKIEEIGGWGCYLVFLNYL